MRIVYKCSRSWYNGLMNNTTWEVTTRPHPTAAGLVNLTAICRGANGRAIRALKLEKIDEAKAQEVARDPQATWGTGTSRPAPRALGAITVDTLLPASVS